MKTKLPIFEELDFAYLLELMLPLYNIPEFAWLPELFSIVGHETLLKLCKYAGGESIKIPTLEQLQDSIDALQWFYDIKFKKTKMLLEVPPKLLPLVNKIIEVYDVRNSETSDQ